MNLPNNIYFTGVPGSRWSGIAQIIESIPGFNITDRTPERTYLHSEYSGHKGAYFGEAMEFPAVPSQTDQGYEDPNAGCKVLKSHDWAYMLDYIKKCHIDRQNNWIMLIYRPDLISYSWWFQAGGFNIKYPNYSAYKDPQNMLFEIQKQNNCILEFAYDNNLEWSHFNKNWFYETFKYCPNVNIPEHKDILIAVYKND